MTHVVHRAPFRILRKNGRRWNVHLQFTSGVSDGFIQFKFFEQVGTIDQIKKYSQTLLGQTQYRTYGTLYVYQVPLTDYLVVPLSRTILGRWNATQL